jgi:hypothetical protein
MYSTLSTLQRKRYLFVCINRRAEENPKGCCAAKDSEKLYRALKEEVAARGLAKLEARVHIELSRSMCHQRDGFGRTRPLFLRACYGCGRPRDCRRTRHRPTGQTSRGYRRSTRSIVKIVAIQLQAALAPPVANFRGEGSYDGCAISLQGRSVTPIRLRSHRRRQKRH